ncbi:DUF1080 domain-containing protein [Lacihabitans sp. CCS-44]|uniref:3-keto-disaccharide hydrolase n=1 Tax=Lacihabitans sp. CCS-44 TaxID=2487331 RepID=UPI0020CCD01D|nr:DUF1080 domain-containing protein [Lacihabitans sp. CCS-44]MCP9756651.1 DUF1080 domain-containing protein [Lacihabitans sp. CCS-44]
MSLNKAFLLILWCVGFSVTAQKPAVSLFNGKDFTGWHIDVPKLDENPNGKNPFIIREGKLVSLAEPQGHIITDKIYENFELEVQYRFAGKPGNCGVLVFCSTPRILYKMFPKSIECQLMHTNAGDFWCIGEDVVTPNMETRRGKKEDWGVTEGKERRVKNLTDNSERPVGEWNTMKVRCDGNKITVWVNGDLVNEGLATANKGQIALQAEGSEVEFRKVELREL